MNIYIPNVKKPRGGMALFITSSGEVFEYDRVNQAMRDKVGTIKEIEDHGDLVDRDKLNLDHEVEMSDNWSVAHEIANVVKYAKPVIPASEKE